jgi:glutathione S-transferase
LTGRHWLALDHPTVADVAAYPAIAQAGDGGITLEGYPAVQAWVARMQALPEFVALLD